MKCPTKSSKSSKRAGKRKETKRLFVFDFDDTLAKTNNVVYVYKKDGRTIELNSAEYLTYQKEDTDEFDFDDFTKPRDAKAIGWTVRLLRAITRKNGVDGAVVLTARTRPEPVFHFLEQYNLPRIQVMALGKPKDGSHPTDKAQWIKWVILQFGFNEIEFFDDCEANIIAVNEMAKQFEGTVRIRTHLIQE